MSGVFLRPLGAVGAALSLGAGLIHLALAPKHTAELGLLGYGFLVSGALQLGWAGALCVVLLMRRHGAPDRLLRALA